MLHKAENSTAFNTALNSAQALGRGFDVISDTRLLYCKGSSLVEIDGEHADDLRVLEDIIIPNVSTDIECSLGGTKRFHTPALDFHQMAEYFQPTASVSGRIPLGSFNATFNFSGSWQADAAATKSLAMDGVFIALYKVQLSKLPLVLCEEVKRAVPSTWEPVALARFVESFGTHIVTAVTVGGRDVIYVKQQHSSPLSSTDIEKYLKEIGDRRFSDLESQARSIKDKVADPLELNDQAIYSLPSNVPHLTGRGDVTIIFRRRGGDDLVQNHKEWVTTVLSAPDVIDMSFVPITSLLDGVPGKDHLKRAIDLYLEYKPPIEELRYFLEFQFPRAWAPHPSGMLGQQKKEPVCPALQFSLMGPKLYVSTVQVSVGRKPVTGLRLHLEGKKHDKLAIHLQYLTALPKILEPHWDAHLAIGPPKWKGPEEQDSRWFEPVQWKNFSHVSTSPIEYSESWIADLSGVYVVTGAQLGVWDFGPKNVLYLRLLFSKVPGCTIRRSVWDHTPTCPQKSNASSSNQKNKKSLPKISGDPDSQSVAETGKLAKFIDMTEMTKGPQESPGHWLVTGAKLGIEKGKILLRVKYSFLNY